METRADLILKKLKEFNLPFLTKSINGHHLFEIKNELKNIKNLIKEYEGFLENINSKEHHNQNH